MVVGENDGLHGRLSYTGPAHEEYLEAIGTRRHFQQPGGGRNTDAAWKRRFVADVREVMMTLEDAGGDSV